MKRILSVVLIGMLALSITGCSGQPGQEGTPTDNDSSVSSQEGTPESGSSSLEVVDEDEEPGEEGSEPDENVSNLDTSSEAEQPEQGGQADQAASQPPVTPPAESKPEVTPPMEQKPVEKEPVQPVTPPAEPEKEPEAEQKPAEQPPAAPAETGWTQEMVDDVVEAYRSAALARGWNEDTGLDINGNGSWGNPMNTNWTRFDVLTDPANIEEYLYMLEHDVGREPEEMDFNIYVQELSDGWEIYFIFGYGLK